MNSYVITRFDERCQKQLYIKWLADRERDCTGCPSGIVIDLDEADRYTTFEAAEEYRKWYVSFPVIWEVKEVPLKPNREY